MSKKTVLEHPLPADTKASEEVLELASKLKKHINFNDINHIEIDKKVVKSLTPKGVSREDFESSLKYSADVHQGLALATLDQVANYVDEHGTDDLKPFSVELQLTPETELSMYVTPNTDEGITRLSPLATRTTSVDDSDVIYSYASSLVFSDE